MQQHATTEPPPFTASLSMLRASPKGLVQLATDWLIQTRGNRSFETKDPRFQAVGEVMRAAPETFVGADGISWEDLNLTQFWALYFEARKLGSVPAPLLEVLAPLSKTQLGKGAKDMMIVAARARDGISFGELLDLGAVRRSKLLMFSAYQHGGHDVAIQVKKPTSKEALEMLGAGRSRYAWHRRVMTHDQTGFSWLMGLIDKEISAIDVAVVGANSAEPQLLEQAVSLFYDKLTFPEREANYHGVVAGTPEEANQIAVMAFAAAGSAKGAKALALAQGGHDFWVKMCTTGITNVMSMDFLPVCSGPTDEVVGGVCIRAHGHLKARKDTLMTVQAATCLSRSVEQCEWLRAQYKELGVAWAETIELSKLYAKLEPADCNKFDIKTLTDQAGAISELADLRVDAVGPTKAPIKSPSTRSRRL